MIELKTYLQAFAPISLNEMDSVALMNRTDTKFILPQSQLPKLLEMVQPYYQMLEIENERASRYNSKYFDTPEFQFYHEHHRGKADRVKVRIRNYVESGVWFLEVKRKNKKGDTVKNRVSTDGFISSFSDLQREFVETASRRQVELLPSFENAFQRITLVNTELKERCTIDLNLTFNGFPAFGSAAKQLIIIELKQSRLNRKSPVMQALKELQIRPFKMSKYCLGLATVVPQLKQNNFKQKFLKINKIIN
ncbi:MAG: polyphosphate polymerase domain-containing protein [Bacteroidetes bacterium]|nr:polyphosphate polymerase domain-containing protein [Bacteroidota bacterium]